MLSVSPLSRNRVFAGTVFAVLGCLFVLTPAVLADPIQGTVSATGTVTVEGAWDGYLWYRYTYTVEWSGLDHALSHMDLLQLPGCANDDHLFLFPSDLCLPDVDGLSTSDYWEPGDPVIFTVLYEGTFLRTGGDPSMDPDVSPPGLPVIKYEPLCGLFEPGKDGVGVFSFICNVIPTYGTLTDFVLVKHNGDVAVGDLTGAYPSCTPTPEPFTSALLGLGMGGLMVARVRRRK
ncbi:MAG: PEP-CTERM sorting domain-containing protein [Planctomycetes bacterium]|nr:PEP-CTERM sorting domain-containing protein [Planctomycetota bacterium]